MKCEKVFCTAARFGEDVGVIELEVVDDRDLGQVMDELAALVEERGVVFVALDDEPFAVREARALAQIVRDAADEETRVQSIVLEHPRQQRGGGGLAVRAADDQTAFAADEKFPEQIRQRTKAQLVIQRVFGLGIAARDGVANDDEVGLDARDCARCSRSSPRSSASARNVDMGGYTFWSEPVTS
jgi:hypothetical protein